MQLIGGIRSGHYRHVSATRAALDRFEQDRAVAAGKTVWVTGCRSWYLDDRGLPAVWPWSFVRFRQEMETPDLTAFELTS
jgi:hypothetical protein